MQTKNANRPVTKYINENILNATSLTIRRPHESLGSQGYAILKENQNSIEKTSFRQSDSKFLNNFLSKRAQAVHQDQSFSDKLNKVPNTYVSRNNECSDIVVLKSLKGCEPQCIHYDYDESKINEYKRIILSVVFSLSKMTLTF
ncbi:hypothetical protein ROZALSC1DRAFT_20778 [Rozella allomycis CSF55]|uniref:Uncharacterized protein n=1 Tax=Rozella allomycis (strain CSF55) TaxID=988480 RepID=A0A4P9YQ04_ROZAC|nr:hypothetical protein ROZALSC1DRAFT_20778 [Rozella allomycis CSF55]